MSEHDEWLRQSGGPVTISKNPLPVHDPAVVMAQPVTAPSYGQSTIPLARAPETSFRVSSGYEENMVRARIQTKRSLYSLSGPFLYKVQPNDTIESIAAKFFTTPTALLDINKLKTTVKIAAGGKLYIPCEVKQIQVQDGDTLQSIAAEFQVPQELLLTLNQYSMTIKDPERLMIKGMLNIPLSELVMPEVPSYNSQAPFYSAPSTNSSWQQQESAQTTTLSPTPSSSVPISSGIAPRPTTVPVPEPPDTIDAMQEMHFLSYDPTPQDFIQPPAPTEFFQRPAPPKTATEYVLMMLKPFYTAFQEFIATRKDDNEMVMKLKDFNAELQSHVIAGPSVDGNGGFAAGWESMHQLLEFLHDAAQEKPDKTLLSFLKETVSARYQLVCIAENDFFDLHSPLALSIRKFSLVWNKIMSMRLREYSLKYAIALMLLTVVQRKAPEIEKRFEKENNMVLTAEAYIGIAEHFMQNRVEVCHDKQKSHDGFFSIKSFVSALKAAFGLSIDSIECQDDSSYRKYLAMMLAQHYSAIIIDHTIKLATCVLEVTTTDDFSGLVRQPLLFYRRIISVEVEDSQKLRYGLRSFWRSWQTRDSRSNAHGLPSYQAAQKSSGLSPHPSYGAPPAMHHHHHHQHHHQHHHHHMQYQQPHHHHHQYQYLGPPPSYQGQHHHHHQGMMGPQNPPTYNHPYHHQGPVW